MAKEITPQSVLIFVLIFLGSILTVFTVFVSAADTKPPATSKASQNAKSPSVQENKILQPGMPPTVNPITQAAVQGGALTCTSRINQVSTFLTTNTASGAYLFFPNTLPDQRIFSTSIEMQAPNAPAIYASASFAPNASGSCGAVYDAVEYSPKTCLDLERNTYKNLKKTGAIKKDIAILDAGTMKIFLMPAGERGCVVIKKEIVQ